MACSAAPESGDASSEQTPSGSLDAEATAQNLELVAYQAEAGVLKPVTQTISFAEYKAMRDRRLARMKQGQSGVATTRQSLTYRGVGDGPYPIAACDDDRTTWLYSVGSGWNSSGPFKLGCVGAAVGGDDWHGTLDLQQLQIPDLIGPYYQTAVWQDVLASMWVSNTYPVTLTHDGQSSSQPITCCSSMCYSVSGSRGNSPSYSTTIGVWNLWNNTYPSGYGTDAGTYSYFAGSYGYVTCYPYHFGNWRTLAM
jgi:hypothetical protein